MWLLGSKIRWTDLFWLESRELCWQIAALREDSHWHYNIDIVVTQGDMGVRRQGRVMLTSAPVIEININSDLTGSLLFAEATPGSRAGRQRGLGGQFAMPLVSLAHKKYYIGLFFKVSKSPITDAANKWNSDQSVTTLSENDCPIFMYQANWFKAKQFCRYHGLHLASINAEEEQTRLEEHINTIGQKMSPDTCHDKMSFVFYFPGMGEEHFWTSGADQAEEGRYKLTTLKINKS